jgi:hypothetical protein
MSPVVLFFETIIRDEKLLRQKTGFGRLSGLLCWPHGYKKLPLNLTLKSKPPQRGRGIYSMNINPFKPAMKSQCPRMPGHWRAEDMVNSAVFIWRFLVFVL